MHTLFDRDSVIRRVLRALRPSVGAARLAEQHPSSDGGWRPARFIFSPSASNPWLDPINDYSPVERRLPP